METNAPVIVHDIHQKRNIAILLLLVTVSGIVSALYMYSVDRYSLVYYGDASSHLITSRKLLDWKENPGWNQLGTVWLPLPHFLLMFPSIVDGMFFTGFAGLAISLSSQAITSIILYKMVTRVLLRISNVGPDIVQYIAITAALLYALNPNFVYLGITAMTEAPFMLFFVGSAYYFYRWVEDYKDGAATGGVKHLLVSAAFISAATLCRYEGWILPPLLISFVIMTIFQNRTSRNGAKIATGRFVIYVSAILLISISGIAFWLIFNEFNYGDPLEFANAQYYSAASQALHRAVRENLFLQPYNVINVYGITSVAVYGPVVLVAAVVGYLVHRKSKGSRDRKLLLAFLAATPLFTIVSMLIGIGEMTIWFNSRFVILLSPLLVVLAGISVTKITRSLSNYRLTLACIIAGLFAFQLIILIFGPIVTLADAKTGFGYKQTPFAIQAGEKLSQFYDGAGSIMILTGSAQEHRIMIASQIPLKYYDTIIESSSWKPSFHYPWRYDDRLVIISNEPDSDGVSVVKYWNDHRSDLDAHYHVIYQNRYYEILAKR
ncbi:MAG: glycosyltransferase family 39 protein [Nitrososphaera sp.]